MKRPVALVVMLLAVAAVFSNAAALHLLTAKSAEATHFRPQICVNDKLVVWDLCYRTSDGDGLVASSVFYNNRLVLFDLRIPHVYVDYVNYVDIKDDFSDALPHDCWTWESASEFKVICNYEFPTYPKCGSYIYQEEFIFQSDGRIRLWFWIYGPGFSDDHTYRGLFRMDFDLEGAGSDRFYRWDSGAWSRKDWEGLYWDDYYNTGGYKSGYEWLNWNQPTGRAYFIDPLDSDGKSSGTGPYMWVTRYAGGQTEGQEGGAQVYVNGESVLDTDIVDWYRAYKFNSACNPPPFPYLTGPAYLAPVGY